MKSDNDLISASLAAFICTHNACRSQMAEALGRKYGAALFDSCSAGTKPASSIDPTARRLMKELYHMDMEKEQFPKSILRIPHPDILISMGCVRDCPWMGRPFDEDWQLEDPAGKDEEIYLAVIRKIDAKVHALAEKVKAGYPLC
jgi:arsenate reductase (thioredoxin)